MLKARTGRRPWWGKTQNKMAASLSGCHGSFVATVSGEQTRPYVFTFFLTEV
jgi:hypothetical protein